MKPAANLRSAKAALDATEAKISELTARRAARLVVSDDVAELRAIENEIAELDRDAARYRDKIVSLKTECARHEHGRRLRRQATAIEAIAVKVEARSALAGELEAELGKVAEIYARFVASRDQILGHWPADLLPRPSSHDLRSEFLKDRIIRALTSRITSPAMLGQAIGIAAQVKEGADGFLSRLRSARLPDLPASDDDEAAA